MLHEKYRWRAVGAQSWAGLLPAGRDQEGWQDDIQFPVNPLKWHMSLCKDYKQILRRQYSFVHITTPQVALGQDLHTLCGFRVPGNGPSPLSHKQPYLSVCLLVRNFHICRPLSCAPEGVVIIQKINNNNSCTSIVLLYLLCRWGSWGQRGLISLLSNKEEGEASPEPVFWVSDGSLFDKLFSC